VSRVTALVLVRDDATLLPGCVASVRGVVDDVVVVDNGSRDGSSAVAQQLGCTVVDVPDRPLDRARDHVLGQLSGDWVLVIDADERLTTGSAALLRPTLDAAEPMTLGMTVCRLDHVGDGRWAEPHLLRLVRASPDLRYEPTPVHASLYPAVVRAGGRVLPSPVMLHHLDGLLTGRARPKRRRYARLLEQDIARGRRDPAVFLRLSLELAGAGLHDRARAACQVAHGGVALRARARDDAALAALRMRAEVTAGQLRLARRDRSGDTALLRAARRAVDDPATRALPGYAGLLTTAARAAVRAGDRSAALELTIHSLAAFERSPAAHLNAATLLRGSDDAAAAVHRRRAQELNDQLVAPRPAGRGAGTGGVHAVQDALVQGAARWSAEDVDGRRPGEDGR